MQNIKDMEYALQQCRRLSMPPDTKSQLALVGGDYYWNFHAN